MSKNNEQPPAKTDNDVNDAVVSTRQAAKQLGVSVRTVQLWVEAGKLAAWKTAGNHRRIYQWSVNELKAKGKTDEAAETQRRTPAKPAILVVEDDRTTQVYYESMLQMLKLNHTVHFASNGLEGLVSIGRYQPWLVVLDIEMPRMDGIEMVQSLRQQPLTQQLSMIVVSNVDRSEALSRGLPEDCIFYQKPISLQDLSAAIDKLLKDNDMTGVAKQ